MHGLNWFGRGLASNRNRLPLEGIRGRVQVAVLFGLAAVLATGIAMSSSLLAQDPMPDEPTAVPTIENYRVEWEEVDPQENTFKYTFSGTLKNCENLEALSIKQLGYPFDALVAPSNGSFSIEFVVDGDVGFGRMTTATILSHGTDVSASEVTGT